MGGLSRDVNESLAADRNSTQQVADGFLLSRRYAKGQAREVTTLTLVVEGEQGLQPAHHAGILASCAEARDIYRPDEAYLVVESGRGISNAFRKNLKDTGFTLNGPIEFFDRFYRVKGDARASSDSLKAFAALNRHLIDHRVPHAHDRIGLDGKALPGAAPADLFKVLDGALEGYPKEPGVHLVVGQPGGGKSYLFNALYARLFDRFQLFKRRHTAGLYPRPLFFLPEALRKSRHYSFDQLMDALFDTVGAEPVSRGCMDWLHTNGHVMLMFDGMDEFFARQTDLFDVLTQNLLAPNSRAQVVICARDSLLQTNQRLVSFLDNVQKQRGTDAVKAWRLRPWDAAARRQLAWLELDTRRPAAGDAAAEQLVEEFEAAVSRSPALEALTATPFYCKLLLDEFQSDGRNALPEDDLELLDRAVVELLRRERLKLSAKEQEEALDPRMAVEEFDEELAFPFDEFLAEDQIERLEVARDRAALRALQADSQRQMSAFRTELGMQGLIDLLAAAAHAFRRNQALKVAGSGIAVDTLKKLYEAHRAGAAATEDERFRGMLILQQIALFSLGPQRDTVDFTHDLLADYLAARHAAALLRHDPAQIAEAVGDVHVAATPVFERTLKREMALDPDMAAGVKAALASMAGRLANGQGPGEGDAAAFLQKLLAEVPAEPMPAAMAVASAPPAGKIAGIFKFFVGKGKAAR